MTNDQQVGRAMSDLRGCTHDVHLSNSVKEAVMSEARSRYDASSQEGAPSQLFDATTAPRSLSRRTFVRVGTAAAAVGAVFLGLSIIGQPASQDRPAGQNQPTAPLNSNSFVLTAYADAIQEGDAALLATDDFAILGGGWSEGDNGLFQTGHAFNLSCTGNGIRSVVYSLEGDLARVGREFPASDTSTGVPTACVFFEPDAVILDDSDNQGGIHRGSATSFEAEPASNFAGSAGSSPDSAGAQVCTQAGLIVRLIAPSDLSAALKDVTEKGNVLSNDYSNIDNYRAYLEAGDHVTQTAEALYAEAVAQTTLVVEATFEDGSTQTQRYHLAPIDDLAAVYGAYLADCTDAAVQLRASGHEDDTESPERAQYEATFSARPRLYAIAREE